MSGRRYVYSFEQGDGKNKKLFGGKGANLCEMTQIGLPVPPGFVISTEACKEYYNNNAALPEGLTNQVIEEMKALEGKTKKKFGGKTNPLLVSVRSGAAMSMPGMMDTILNLGLNDETAIGMIDLTKNERFVWDSYRRLLQLFGKVALKVDDSLFSIAFEGEKNRVGAKQDTDLSAESLKSICETFKKIIHDFTGKPFPQDPMEQLFIAIGAVFSSWMGKRAIDYRKQFNITPDMADGTAVNICTMVFGNMGNDSATGVAFTRNPGTGENQFYGEFLVNAQGEDVVAGVRTPLPVIELQKVMPEVYKQLLDIRQKLEQHYREVQDLEFTIERGKLYMLQTRNGKMNAWALIHTSTDMVDEGLITKEEAILRVKPELLEQILHRRIDPNYKGQALAAGLPASPGAASGKIVFDADRAEQLGKSGEKIILVREETKPEDIHGFFASQGVLTSRGGKTSHAAVVARGMGMPCVSGCEAIIIDQIRLEASVGGTVLHEGDVVTIDGTTGNVYAGEVPMVDPEFSEDMMTLLKWADENARLQVMGNADTPAGAKTSIEFGATGIGLCRTERMFNQPERLPIVRSMILAETEEERQKYIDQLLPFQREDFKAIFRTMGELPVTVRLLDPPMHEFLPTIEELTHDVQSLKEFSKAIEGLQSLPRAIELLDPDLKKFTDPIKAATLELTELHDKGIDRTLLKYKEEMLRKVKALSEINPMLGHRGVRLGISYPQIYRMQIQGIMEATAELMKEGLKVNPEIMVPQVCTLQELKWVHQFVREVHEDVKKRYGIAVPFKFGTMVEVVRACMRAGSLAELAEFFSFGTNDLTQATFSFSREDAENKFLPLYNQRLILRDNPFEVLDVKGVGQLMKSTVEWGRQTRKDLKIGICGEQAGHPRGVEFCHHIGLNYVSVSPHRIPIARMAAAHAALKEKRGELVLDV